MKREKWLIILLSTLILIFSNFPTNAQTYSISGEISFAQTQVAAFPAKLTLTSSITTWLPYKTIEVSSNGSFSFGEVSAPSRYNILVTYQQNTPNKSSFSNYLLQLTEISLYSSDSYTKLQIPQVAVNISVSDVTNNRLLDNYTVTLFSLYYGLDYDDFYITNEANLTLTMSEGEYYYQTYVYPSEYNSYVIFHNPDDIAVYGSIVYFTEFNGIAIKNPKGNQITINVYPSSNIFGYLHFQSDNATIPNATIFIYPAGNYPFPISIPLIEVTTDANGFYNITVPGNYSLNFETTFNYTLSSDNSSYLYVHSYFFPHNFYPISGESVRFDLLFKDYFTSGYVEDSKKNLLANQFIQGYSILEKTPGERERNYITYYFSFGFKSDLNGYYRARVIYSTNLFCNTNEYMKNYFFVEATVGYPNGDAVNFTIPSTVQLEGVISFSDGSAIPSGSTIIAMTNNETPLITSPISSDGNFKLALYEQTFSLQVSYKIFGSTNSNDYYETSELSVVQKIVLSGSDVITGSGNEYYDYYYANSPLEVVINVVTLNGVIKNSLTNDTVAGALLTAVSYRTMRDSVLFDDYFVVSKLSIHSDANGSFSIDVPVNSVFANVNVYPPEGSSFVKSPQSIFSVTTSTPFTFYIH